MSSPAEHSQCAICAADFRSNGEVYDGTKESLARTNAYWALTFHMQEAHADVMFECPRQAEGFRSRGEREAYWRKDCTCSYCGSLSEAEFFKAAEAGCKIGPTDKNYKAYVDLPNQDEGKPRVVSWESGPAFNADGTPTRDDLTAEEVASGTYRRERMGVEPAVKTGKFYFQHLSTEGRDKFIALVNEKKMNIGYPGHFYSMPYFCQPAERAPA